MGKHVLKLFGITLVGLLAILIPVIIIALCLYLIQSSLFTDAMNINNFETITDNFGKYLIYNLSSILLFSLIGAFFLGGIYGTANEAISQGHTTVSSFFRNGSRYYGKMLGYSILSSLIYFVYNFVTLDLYNLAELTGMVENNTSLIIDLLLFVVFVLLLPVFIVSPILIINEGIGVFRSFVLSYKTFGKSLLTSFLTFLIFVGITLIYFSPLFIIAAMGIISFSSGEFADFSFFINEQTLGTAFLLLLLLTIIYYFVVFPFSLSFCVLFAVNRYHKRIRPALFGDAPTTQPYIPGGVSYPYNPTQPIAPNPPQPPIQPTEPEQPNFTFQVPDSNSNEQTKQNVDEDTGRFTF